MVSSSKTQNENLVQNPEHADLIKIHYSILKINKYLLRKSENKNANSGKPILSSNDATNSGQNEWPLSK